MRTSAILPEGEVATPFSPPRRSRQPQIPSLVAEMDANQPTPQQDFQQRAYMARQIQSQEQDAQRQDVATDKFAAKAQADAEKQALNAENSQALGAFKQTGEQHYVDPLTKKLVGTGSFTKKVLPEETDPATGYPLKVVRTETGEVKKTPNVEYGIDPATGNFVSKNKATGQVIRPEDVEKAAMDPNVSIARPAVTHLFRQEEGKRHWPRVSWTSSRNSLSLSLKRFVPGFLMRFRE